VVAGTAESLVFVDGKRGSSWFGDFKASLGNRVKLYKSSQLGKQVIRLVRFKVLGKILGTRI